MNLTRCLQRPASGFDFRFSIDLVFDALLSEFFRPSAVVVVVDLAGRYSRMYLRFRRISDPSSIWM